MVGYGKVKEGAEVPYPPLDQGHADKGLFYCSVIERWTVGSRQLAGKIGPREQEHKAVLGLSGRQLL